VAALVQEWMIELLKGLGRLLLNPVFYYLFFLAAILGVSRVKRERKNFHVRAENAYFELRQLLPLGFATGLVLSNPNRTHSIYGGFNDPMGLDN